jgi:hypothetical protein
VADDRGSQSIKLTTGNKGILASQSLDRALADDFALAHALNEIEVAVAPCDSFDDEHSDVVTDKSTLRRVKKPMSTKCCYYTFSSLRTRRNTINDLEPSVPLMFSLDCSSRAME